MIWYVEYSAEAYTDIAGIHQYISDVLFAPDAAEKQFNRIMDAIDSLTRLPLRYRLYDKEPWRSRGLRVMPVDRYLIFYLPDEVRQIVYIVRIMYAGRNIEAGLAE